MTRHFQTRPSSFVVLAVVAAIGAAACADGPATGTRAGRIEITDTLQSTASVSELQQRRATWVARGINDYRVQLRVVCFCGSEITRPVIVEVRGGVVANVSDVETAKPVTNLTPYPSITALFDAAIAERSRGGHVSAVYDGATGLPVRLEIGTLANDAGVQYELGAVTPL